MELSGPDIKKFLLFSQKKLFLYFKKWNHLKISYISGGNFPSSKKKKKIYPDNIYIIFQEIEL